MLLHQSMVFIMYKKKKKNKKNKTPQKTTQVQIKFAYQINYALII